MSIKIKEPLKYISLFSGIGSPEQALKELNIPYELIGFSEIDKFAIKSYCAIHNVSENMNLGDITKIDIEKLPKNIDLLTHGSPCQSFSVAGKNHGGDEGSGTRSSLMWNSVEIIKHCKPNVVIWENVKNVLSKKHKHNFDKYIDRLEELGYNNYYKVLNAKNYGVPQNRERIFVISIRKEIDDKTFKFPEPYDNGVRLKHILEKVVDEKYYIDNKKCEKLIEEYIRLKENSINIEKINSEEVRFKEKDSESVKILPCISPSKEVVRQNGRRLKDNEEPMFTLTCQDRHGMMILNKKEDTNKIIIEGNYMPSNHDASRVVNKEGICPCVKENHGTVTGVIVESDTQVLRTVRTEYGKKVRKDYESGDLKESRHNMTMLEPRKDGIANTLTTVIKDNLVLESNELKFINGIGDKDIAKDGKGLSRNFPQGNRVYDENGIACSQTANGGGLGGKTGLYLVGTLEGGYEQNNRVYDEDGICPTIMAGERANSSGGYVSPKILTENKNSIIKLETPQIVRVRKYEVDILNLQKTLRKHKKSSKLTNKDIANKLNIPLTIVSHWFRTDSSFSIPSEDIWFNLKALLNIDTDTFDLSITEFEEREGTYEKSNRCYSEEGIAPTLTCSGYGEKIITQQLDKCINCERLNYVDKKYIEFFKKNGYIPEMYNPYNDKEIEEIAPTVTTNCGSTTGSSTVLIKEDDTSKIMQIGNIDKRGGWNNPQTGRVYNPEGYSPCLTCMEGGNLQPKVIIESNNLNQIGEIDVKDNKRQRRVYGIDGISPSLLARQDSPKILNAGKIDIKGSEQVKRVYEVEGISPTLDTMQGGHRQPKVIDKDYEHNSIYKYRVRKLTPKECWRLMAFPDSSFEKAQEINSNSQLYKQAGNSIVVSVMKALFEMIYEIK